MPPASGNIKVTLEGRGPLTLHPGDYLAGGGEGSIYRINNTVVKLYHDSGKMIKEGMVDKIKLLSRLKHQYVMSPDGVVTDSQSRAIGFYLPYADGEPLARVFTTSFRQRQKFGDKEAMTLVDRMREVVRFAHDHQAVLVDPNELNWLTYLLGTQGPEPRIIDVDSWAIGHWKARAIMPSIRDWHSKDFNEMTDWFSWGIVTFQVFTGIHPYKGTLDGYRNNDLESRMKTNASVFLPDVRLNRAVRDFSCIPGSLLDWYKVTFQQGQRTIPPSPFDKAIGPTAPMARTYRLVTTATGALVFDLLFKKTNDSVIRLWPCGVVLLNSGELINLSSQKAIGKMVSPDGELIQVKDGWLISDWINSELKFFYIDDRSFQVTELSLNLRADKLIRYENRLFLVTDRELVELQLMFAGRPILAVGQRTQILQPKATRWFDGFGFQEAMGAVFLVTPFGDASCITLRVKELDGFKPITGKAGNRFITIIAADKTGSYHKIEIIPNKDYSSYQVRRETVDAPELNVSILPKGVCAAIDEDGKLIIFVPTSGVINEVADKMISTDLILGNWDNRVLFIKNGEVWSVAMR